MSIQEAKTSKGSPSDEQSNENNPAWQNISDCLTIFLNMMKENYVCGNLVVQYIGSPFARHFRPYRAN